MSVAFIFVHKFIKIYFYKFMLYIKIIKKRGDVNETFETATNNYCRKW